MEGIHYKGAVDASCVAGVYFFFFEEFIRYGYGFDARTAPKPEYQDDQAHTDRKNADVFDALHRQLAS